MRAVVVVLLMISAPVVLTGCAKHEGDAILVSKEHIAAAEPKTEDRKVPGDEINSTREMAPDEIAVDGLVMKARDRGTGRDPRATKDEQWLTRVRLVDNGRALNAPVDKVQFGRLHEGDRVHVRYQVGKYTGTVWSAEIVNP